MFIHSYRVLQGVSIKIFYAGYECNVISKTAKEHIRKIDVLDSFSTNITIDKPKNFYFELSLKFLTDSRGLVLREGSYDDEIVSSHSLTKRSGELTLFHHASVLIEPKHSISIISHK